MKKIENTQFEETYYEETLSNGLSVIVWHKPEFTSSTAVFGTPFGALDYQQVDLEGKSYEYPAGSAHFLEHKLFESAQGDVMDQFSNLGANVNAFTSYNETVYYFSSTSDDLITPLNLLMDFVQDLSISEESVEKEKGIIVQELKMYQQMPDSRLIFETFKSLYHEHPLKLDIGGNEESVMATTLDALSKCHAINYHPSKMNLIVVSGKDPEKLMQAIRDNQAKKTFPAPILVNRKEVDEPITVCRPEFSVEMEVSNEKVSVGIKLNQCFTTAKERIQAEWALRFVLEAHFSSLNPHYQSWLDQKIINDYFSFDVDVSKDYSLIMFFNETDQSAEFKTFILSELESIKNHFIDFETCNQLKRRYFGQALNMFNGTEEIAVTFLRHLYVGANYFDTLNMIESLTQDKMKEVFNSLDLSNVAVCKIVGKQS